MVSLGEGSALVILWQLWLHATLCLMKTEAAVSHEQASDLMSSWWVCLAYETLLSRDYGGRVSHAKLL